MNEARQRRPQPAMSTTEEKKPIKSWDSPEEVPVSKRSFWSRTPPDTPELVSIVGFCLGVLFTVGLSTGIKLPFVLLAQEERGGWSQVLHSPQLGLYLAFWALFHMCEYLTTAIYNPTQVKLGSYLLHNGLGYHLAHLCGLLEYTLSDRLLSDSLQQYKHLPIVIVIGIIVTALGQYGRSLAMITAASNFNHDVQFTKSDSHVLVTSGIYSYSRHPSYAAFFYWAVGTQILLGNPFTACVFIVVLWRFFTQRIFYEEMALTEFFGEDYVNFKKRTGTLIPFCR